MKERPIIFTAAAYVVGFPCVCGRGFHMPCVPCRTRAYVADLLAGVYE